MGLARLSSRPLGWGLRAFWAPAGPASSRAPASGSHPPPRAAGTLRHRQSQRGQLRLGHVALLCQPGLQGRGWAWGAGVTGAGCHTASGVAEGRVGSALQPRAPGHAEPSGSQARRPLSPSARRANVGENESCRATCRSPPAPAGPLRPAPSRPALLAAAAGHLLRAASCAACRSRPGVTSASGEAARGPRGVRKASPAPASAGNRSRRVSSAFLPAPCARGRLSAGRDTAGPAERPLSARRSAPGAAGHRPPVSCKFAESCRRGELRPSPRGFAHRPHQLGTTETEGGGPSTLDRNVRSA